MNAPSQLPPMNERNDIAVRVDNVSKYYALWSSPLAPLASSASALAQPLLWPFPKARERLDARVQHWRRDFHALSDVSLEIKKGESWGFIGVNGSGKSTLLKMISGNLTPTEGRIEVDGKVAILDYSSGLHGAFSGRENIYLKGSILGLSRKEIDRKFSQITDFADIGHFIDQPVKTYSSGMTARLGFAILAHVDADIIITDEALAVGDAGFVQKCMRHIRKFLEHGTFLFVSHSINDVMSLCDHAIWLEHGKMRMIGDSKKVCLAYVDSSEEAASNAYLDNQPLVEKPCEMSGEQLAQLRQYVCAPRDERSMDRSEALYTIDEKLVQSDALLDQFEGVGGGRIVSVQLLNTEKRALSYIMGGEEVILRVHVAAERVLSQPIIGFQLRNRTGLTLFADNTSDVTLNQRVEMGAGEVLAVDFRFRMPLLPPGDYAFRVGFADGNETDNAIIDKRHEVLIVSCLTSGARHGLVGIPMLGIAMRKVPVVVAA